MADGTRVKDLQEQQKRQEVLLVEERTLREARDEHFQGKINEIQTSLNSSHESLHLKIDNMQNSFHQQMQSILEQMHQFNRGKSLLGEGLSAPVERSSNSPQHVHDARTGGGDSSGSQWSSSFPRVDFPYFDGNDARGWVRDANWYFQVLPNFPEEQKVPLASVHLQGKARVWFHNFMEGGIIRRRGKICIGDNDELKTRIIKLVHDTALGGHSGIHGTYQRIKGCFYWPRLKQDVENWVKECDTCQRNKHETVPYPGLLQPLSIPDKAWSHISMDFVEGLPRSEGKDAIMVVVDRYTKFSHFIALSHPFSAAHVAKLFMDHVYKLHGMPANIVSDRDKVFTSIFWKELFKLSGTTLSLSTAYHPQSDGQTERVNQCLENYLRCMCHLKPKSWNKWLTLAEFWYNTNFHQSLKMTPFQALYGYPPPNVILGAYAHSNVAQIREWGIERSRMTELLKENLQNAQNRMRSYANKSRSEREFKVGDWVYLRLQPHRQNSLALRRNLKLAPKYYGPYDVTAKVGQVAYRLALPPESHIHPVFHVSLLKKKIGHKHAPSSRLPEIDDDGVFKIYPVAILARRLIPRNNVGIPQVLIQWAHSSPNEATWEDYTKMKRRFPKFDNPCGQGSSPAGGNVRALTAINSLNLDRWIGMRSSRWMKRMKRTFGANSNFISCSNVVLGEGRLDEDNIMIVDQNKSNGAKESSFITDSGTNLSGARALPRIVEDWTGNPIKSEHPVY